MELLCFDKLLSEIKMLAMLRTSCNHRRVHSLKEYHCNNKKKITEFLYLVKYPDISPETLTKQVQMKSSTSKCTESIKDMPITR